MAIQGGCGQDQLPFGSLYELKVATQCTFIWPPGIELTEAEVYVSRRQESSLGPCPGAESN